VDSQGLILLCLWWTWRERPLELKASGMMWKIQLGGWVNLHIKHMMGNLLVLLRLFLQIVDGFQSC